MRLGVDSLAARDSISFAPPEQGAANAFRPGLPYSLPIPMPPRKPPAQGLVPIILAAGPPRSLPFPKALAPFGEKTALELAVESCRVTRGLAPPIVVLGCHARRILRCWRAHHHSRLLPVRFIQNPRWKQGQLSSLLAGLRRLPRRSPGFVIYPVDYPLVSSRLLARLLRAFRRRARRHHIVAPARGRRTGHPLLVSRQVSLEFFQAARSGGTARDVIYRTTRPDRVLRVRVRDAAIFRDFDSPVSYRLCVPLWERHSSVAQSSRKNRPRK